MKNIFLFFLMSFGGFFTLGIILINGTSSNLSKRKALVENYLSEELLSSMEEKYWDKGSQNDSIPIVELVLSEEGKSFSWDSQVRYTIKVSDTKDGDARYGEISGNAVILEVEYFPFAVEEEIREKKKVSEEEHKGLELMSRSTCFGCHADKARLAGPSFSEIAERYEGNSENIKSLAGKILGGSSGVWGSSVMPAHPNLTQKESEQIADYILTQGRKKNNWILPGLEGTFRIIPKPHDYEKGVYILTASYVSKLQVRGKDSKLIKIE